MKYCLSVFLVLILFGTNFSCKSLKPKTDPSSVATSTTEFDHWIHRPLHPANRQGVSFAVQVADELGIQKVELQIFEFELYQDKNNFPSKRRRPNGLWGKVKTWDFTNSPKALNLDYVHAAGFPARSNVEYIFKITNIEGTSSERLALFDAGDSPWGTDKITLYATTRDPMKNTINLCFIADEDYQNDWNNFLQDAEDVIYTGYHENNKIKSHKDKWNFYYTRQTADGRKIINDPFNENSFPSFLVSNKITGVDAFGLLHRTAYSDGAYLKANFSFLAYNLFTSEGYNKGTAVHETAHAIFNLSDEYNGCVCFESPHGSNVFPNESDCENFNERNGFPAKDCSIIRHVNDTDWYMSEKSVLFPTRASCEAFNVANGFPKDHYDILRDIEGIRWYRALGGLCIMQDDGDDVIRDFQRTCGRLIDQYYQRLTDSEAPLAATTPQENIFGYEEVVLLELTSDDQEGITVAVKAVAFGVPTKDLAPKNYLSLDMMDKKGKEKYHLSINDPGGFRIHAEEEGDTYEHQSRGTCQLAIPYTKDLEKVVCQYETDFNKSWAAKSIKGTKPQQEKMVFDIGKKCKAKAKQFSKRKKQPRKN